MYFYVSDDYQNLVNAHFTDCFDGLLPLFDSSQQHAILRVRYHSISFWLLVLPLVRSQFDHSVQKFRDSLTLAVLQEAFALFAICL